MRNIRNFCIIAHVDHGKSTLADRFLEITHTVDPMKMHEQYMDTLKLEQERGITIKLQTARMKYVYKGEEYVLNLIDTPGHVDFSFEVERSLAACEGAILLIDATQGVQAQTLSTAYLALEHNLEIIPVVNKIDIAGVNVAQVKEEIENLFGFKQEEILSVSGKTGEGVDYLIETVIDKIPSPQQPEAVTTSRALIFDSFYDNHKGVVLLIKVKEGEINASMNLSYIKSGVRNRPIEVGYLRPYLEKADGIRQGEVGYIATGLKDLGRLQVGDTVSDNINASLLQTYKAATPMVFASLFPMDADKQDEFKVAIEKLGLNDSAFVHTPQNLQILGLGYRCGFLGLLHLDVVRQRLEDEFDIQVIITVPSVEYQIKLYGEDNEITVSNALDFPVEESIEYIKEPWVHVEIITPNEYMGSVLSLGHAYRGELQETIYISEIRSIIKFDMPYSQILTDFFDKLKSATSGYASMSYEPAEYRFCDVVKLRIVLNKEPVEALSSLVYKDQAKEVADRYVKRLSELIPRHQFLIPIQACLGSHILARADVKAYRKDVTAKLYGGDPTRRMKLLEKQKRGKKRMKMFGKVEIPSEAFYKILQTDY